MAALPSYGVDPQTGQPAQMPQVDPNSPPADPNLDVHAADSYGTDPSIEATTTDRVELCGLLAAETCAKAVEAGIGASDREFAVAYAQAFQYLCLGIAALANAESKDPDMNDPQGPPATPSVAPSAIGTAPMGVK